MIPLSKVLRVTKEELAADPRRIAAHLVSWILPQNSFNRLRTVLLRALGLRIAATSSFGGSVHITGSGSVRDRLSIGPGCHVTGPLHIDLTAPVTIGAHVYIGYDVMLITTDHAVGPSLQRCGHRLFRPICIEDGVWIGSRTLILPGVRVGHGSVVAAGAVVTRDVPPDTLVGGVPARRIRDYLKDAVMRNETGVMPRAPATTTSGAFPLRAAPRPIASRPCLVRPGGGSDQGVLVVRSALVVDLQGNKGRALEADDHHDKRASREDTGETRGP
jgi:maltose O-acetyltransferase